MRPVMQGELSDVARLRLIVRAFEDCGQQVSRAAVMKQFRRETGRDPEEGAVKKVMSVPVVVMPVVDAKGRKVLEVDAKGKPVVVDQGPAPLWSDIHGLTKSGLDGVVEIAKELQDQIKALTEQLQGVKDEIQRELKECGAGRVRMDDETVVTVVKPQPYLGGPKREKLVELGVAGETIDKACSLVTPKAYVKIAPPKEG